jgi:hypothetical protein
MTENQAQQLWQICSSTRAVNFQSGDKIIKAVSVANRDSKRPEVIEILKDQKTLWPPGACNSGMVMWIHPHMVSDQ